MRINEKLSAVQISGQVENRINLVILNVGYTVDEQDEWAAHVDDVVARLFDADVPYQGYRNFINVYRMDLVSAESGVDNPENGTTVDTRLDGADSCIDWRIGQCQIIASKRYRETGKLCPFPAGTFPPRIPTPREVL
jgi:hypothetical protein